MKKNETNNLKMLEQLLLTDFNFDRAKDELIDNLRKSKNPLKLLEFELNRINETDISTRTTQVFPNDTKEPKPISGGGNLVANVVFKTVKTDISLRESVKRDYLLLGKEPDWSKVNDTNIVYEFAKGKYEVEYKLFVEREIEKLKTETAPNNLTVEILQKVSHRIVLLHELGIIDHLKKEYKDLKEETFAKLIAVILGENTNVETTRKAIVYLNTKHKNNPVNELSTNKVKSILANLGIELKRLKEY